VFTTKCVDAGVVIWCEGIDRYLRLIDAVVSSVAQSERKTTPETQGQLEMNVESAQHYRRQEISRRYLAGLCLAMMLASVGCSHAPEYSIFGSFFPVWIFCSAGGLLLMAGARAVIARTAIAEHLVAPVLLYLSMATFFGCMFWLVFYN